MSIQPAEGRSIEALRAALREARTVISPRTIAREADVSHTKVYELLGDGDAGGTQPEIVTALWRWVDDWRQETSAPRSDGEPVRISPLLAAYWRGRVESDLRSLIGARLTLEALTESLQALSGLFESATGGVRGFVESGILPVPHGAELPAMPATPVTAATVRAKKEAG